MVTWRDAGFQERMSERTGPPLSEVTCHKCGRKGHYQKMCHFPPVYFTCKEERHTVAQRPSHASKSELVMHGFGMRRLGF